MANYGKRMVSEVDIAQIGQGGGSEYTAGTGIDITEDVISVDNTVALKTDVPTVVANPTLAGTEDTLTGLQVGDTKYAVPQGGSGATLYRHTVYIKNKSSYTTTTYIRCEFINTDNTEYNTANASAFITYITSRFTDYTHALPAYGAIRDTINNTDLKVSGIMYSTGDSKLAAVHSLEYGTDEFGQGRYQESVFPMTTENYRFYDNVTTV